MLKNELGFEEIRAFEVNPKRAQEASKTIKDIQVFDSIEKTVEGVDAVIVCTPTSKHIENLTEINKLGRFHLFIEKPFSHTLAGCEELIHTQERANKITFIGYVLQFHPMLIKAKELLDANTIGRIISARAERGLYLPEWHPWEDYRDFYMSWKAGGGGVILDVSHEINYLNWLVGNICEVKGYFETLSDLEVTSDDISVFLCRFDNNAIGQVHLDMIQHENTRNCKIIGTTGTLEFDFITGTLRFFTKASKKWESIKYHVNFDEVYRNELRAFVNNCKGNKDKLISGREGKVTMDVIEAVRRSHQFGTAIRLPLYN